MRIKLMQETKEYAGNRALVKPSSKGKPSPIGQRVECRINTRRGTLRLAGSMAEVLDWLRAQCPTGKIAEIAEVRA